MVIMTDETDVIGRHGLQFFGKISASISHEIKNVLAVIGENAGLLQDFASLAERGHPIEPERLIRLSKDIMKQVQRADTIMKHLNMLAHSVDNRSATVELGGLVELVTQLCARFTSLKGVTLEKKLPAGPVMVATNPFLLENLIGICIDAATDSAGASKSVMIQVESTELGARIRFSGLKVTAGQATGLFTSKPELALLAALKAVIEINAGPGELVLTLPPDIGAQTMTGIV
jgi:C4-dicarboxylate-specific signal transduction histidine kinase